MRCETTWPSEQRTFVEDTSRQHRCGVVVWTPEGGWVVPTHPGPCRCRYCGSQR